MQIKQFAADTIDEVLAQVRAELGEDAMILQTKRVVRGGIGGFFGKEGVEVTAAAGEDAGVANQEAAASVAVPSLDVLDTPEEAARKAGPTAGSSEASRAAAIRRKRQEAAGTAPAPRRAFDVA